MKRQPQFPTSHRWSTILSTILLSSSLTSSLQSCTTVEFNEFVPEDSSDPVVPHQHRLHRQASPRSRSARFGYNPCLRCHSNPGRPHPHLPQGLQQRGRVSSRHLPDSSGGWRGIQLFEDPAPCRHLHLRSRCSRHISRQHRLRHHRITRGCDAP